MGASFALISLLTGARQVSCLFLYNHFSVWSWHMLDNKERFIVWIHGRTSLIKAHSQHVCSYMPLCAEASLCAVQKTCSFICPQEAHMASHPGGEGARCCILRWAYLHKGRASSMSQMVKNLFAMQETQVRSLGWEDPLERGMTIHSSILALRIPWTEVSGGLQSMRLQRVGHNWATHTCRL